MSVVTISRLDASRGDEVAALAARRLGYRLVDRSLMKELIYSYDLLASLGKIGGAAEGAAGDDARIREATEGIIHHLAFKENILLLGHGGQFLFRGWPSVFHVRILASLEYRLRHYSSQGRGRPERILLRREGERRRLVKKYFGDDITRAEHYDLTLQMDTFGVEGAVEMIVCAVGELNWPPEGAVPTVREHGQRLGVREIVLDPIPAEAGRGVHFAHPSEAEFARVLDFYRIRWEYEPESFPIAWWPDGRVRESFTPDFYLPDLDVFLELTTMKQSLVTKKNRKVRKFRELYPDRTLNIFYGRDFRKLALKYGLE